ncbi:AAA family ATPase [Epidermidibacterium keratini]|uniref:AAA family ATPase n=1 Tax=Epidermidibacterium keratini TaxID=1891644 RepID=A0A7L4YPL2_9ACTN|nr:AAA family ATPase [Epidermidibacterium keratini]QHC00962.1 AAA family ATPase [Epidermidibacterium keratini]
MLQTLAISGYRSLRSVVVPLAPLTVVSGANGTGKSSLYRALRLLADCGQGHVVGSLAREGGLSSALWAGPESLKGARRGAPVQGTVRKEPVAVQLGFGSDEFGYIVDLGLPQCTDSAFSRDPQIKRELVFSGSVMRPATTLVRRKRRVAEVRDAGGWSQLAQDLPAYRSVLAEYADPHATPELSQVREQIRSWRFHDGFRVDAHAPARQVQVGTRTPVLADDGADLAAAVATIKQEGLGDLESAIAEAFDGATLSVHDADGLFELRLQQSGMLRPLRAAELSDGTLRYIMWATALLTVEPPPLLVLNEPETSLHPDLLEPLASLVRAAANRSQVIVVSHSRPFIERLGAVPLDEAEGDEPAIEIELVKDLGETMVAGQGLLTRPRWEWGSR